VTTTISKAFDFDAAHFLPNVPQGHKCGRMHGHTYKVELICVGQIDEKMGWFCDYADIESAWMKIHHQLDHHLLNGIEGLENPTTEVLANWIVRKLAPELSFLARVRVYESSTTWVQASVASAWD
jgi:6-pyruvoyltetrahydropterin/6-carboxytetrahydropterin synthase